MTRTIDFSHLEFEESLGEGGFGTVYKGKWKIKNLDVAIKKISGTIRDEEVSRVHYIPILV